MGSEDMKIQRKKKKDDHLQTKERDIRIKQPCQDLDIRLLSFRIVKKNRILLFEPFSLWFLFWQPHHNPLQTYSGMCEQK